MPTYACLLGTSPELSWVELSALVSAPTLVSPRVALIELDNEEAAKSLQTKIAGVIKIASVFKIFPAKTKVESLEQEVADYLAMAGEKLTFGVGNWNIIENVDKLGEVAIKKHLQKAKRKARFLEGTNDGLSAAILIHQDDVIEINLIANPLEDTLLLARTITTQNIDDWTFRDRSRPFADRKRGMLPNKIARTLVNLNQDILSTSARPTIYDPFVGSGTILMEALMLGYNVIGSDLSDAAVAGAKQNLEWVKEQYQLPGEINIFPHDVTQNLKKNDLNFDVIITEPYLGKPNPSPQDVPNIIKGLEKLYLGAFKRWSEDFSNLQYITIILPKIHTQNKTMELNNLIDKLPSLGYTTHLGPIPYFRPGAVTERMIYRYVTR